MAGADGPVAVIRPPGQLDGRELAWPSPLTGYGTDQPGWRPDPARLTAKRFTACGGRPKVSSVVRDYGVIERIDAFCDAVPRRRTRAEEHGPLEVFVPVGMSWPYYARPRQGSRPPVTAADIRAVRARQRELIIPESFEWIEESAPEMATAAAEAGLEVRRHPLMVLAAPVPVPPLPPGITVRIVAPEDAELDRIWAVPAVAFSHPGTAVGEAGAAERDKIAADHDGGTIAMLRERLRSGQSVLAAAFGPDGPLAAGSCQAVDGVAEITGVGVLPSHRRQGLGAAVTALLAADAAGRDVRDHLPVRQRPRGGPRLRPDRVPRDRHGRDRRAGPLAEWPGLEGTSLGSLRAVTMAGRNSRAGGHAAHRRAGHRRYHRQR